jgi:hypothetical protein
MRSPAHSGQIERAQFPNSQSHERTDYANGIRPKTGLTRAGGLAFDVRQVPGGCLYASALGLQHDSWPFCRSLKRVRFNGLPQPSTQFSELLG